MAMSNSGAGFSTSAGARNLANGLNPLTPGGMSPQNTHLPTLGWAVVFLVAAFLLYHFVIKKGKR
jgi:hypothetical protein